MIRRQTCPICDHGLPLNNDSQQSFFPFCSPRCQRVDFLRWCQGRYAIVEPLPREVAEFLDSRDSEQEMT